MRKVLISVVLFIGLFNPGIWAQLRIMPLGDSITRGATGSSTNAGYRELLYTFLTSAGYEIDFVGSDADGNSSIPDPDHEGHSGFAIWQIRDKVQGYLQGNPADIILLHIGTNDIEFNTIETTNDFVDKVDSALNNIDNYSQDVFVFLAKIILDDNDNEGVDGTKATRTKDYNNKLVAMAANRLSDNLIVVNMQDALIYPEAGAVLPSPGNRVGNTDLFYDNNSTLLHPYQSGYDKMATIWFDAIQYHFTPELLNPIANSTDQPVDITLTWQPPAGYSSATRYRLQVSSDSLFNNPEFDESNIANTFKSIMPGVLDSGTTYYWRINSINYEGISYWSDIWDFTTTTAKGVLVSAKIFLQGPYISDSMSTFLNPDYLPDNQPYNSSPWNYSGTESVNSGFYSSNSSIVDWVLLELRNSATQIVSRRAAFLKSNGRIVDTDGINPVSFKDVLPGNYYIVVKHRNHLGVMSSVTLPLEGASSLVYDFTTDQAQAYTTGSDPMAGLGDSKFGMYSGDANGDGSPDAFDNNIFWRPSNGQPYNYSNGADYNMDGGIDAFDSNLYWQPNNGKTTQVSD
jgi:hypothetical protein